MYRFSVSWAFCGCFRWVLILILKNTFGIGVCPGVEGFAGVGVAVGVGLGVGVGVGGADCWAAGWAFGASTVLAASTFGASTFFSL